MVAVVAVTLVSLSLNSLTVTLLDVAVSSSEMAGRQVQAFLLRRLTESLEAVSPKPVTLAATRDFWNTTVSKDADLAALLEQTMAQSRSIVEISIASDHGVIIASSNPQTRGAVMKLHEDLRSVREANPLGRIVAILNSDTDYETRVPLGLADQKDAIYTIQILISPVLLRASTMPALRGILLASGLALMAAFFLAWWSATLALRPLARIGHILDDIASGRQLPPPNSEDARELAIIEDKLSLLGERFRDAREEATRGQLDAQLALARRLTAINSLTGRVAHEIKNPLNAINLRLETLRAGMAGEDPGVDEEFAVLSSEVMRLDRVVRTFLDFNRPVDLHREPVDLVDMVAGIIAFLEPQAEAQGVTTAFVHPDDPVVIDASRDLLRQALLNIAVNAIEAMSEGGALRVQVQSNPPAVSIADTGPGIAPDQLEKIFQLYFTTKPQGSGIGLAMAFRTAQLHGGTIEVKSEMGKGTEFRMVLGK